MQPNHILVSFKTPFNTICVVLTVCVVLSICSSVTSIVGVACTMSSSPTTSVQEIRAQALEYHQAKSESNIHKIEKRLTRLESDMHEVRFKILPAIMMRLDNILQTMGSKPERKPPQTQKPTAPVLMSDVY